MPVTVSTVKSGDLHVTVAMRDGVLLADAFSMSDVEDSKRHVLYALRKRGITEFVTDDASEDARRVAEHLVSGKGTEPVLCFDGMTDFARRVLTCVKAIPKGAVRSYREVAESAGRPRAYRAVGNIMANNPYPLIIPCHRVVKSDRSLGGFGLGSAKVYLLRKEGLDIEDGKITTKQECAEKAKRGRPDLRD